MSHTLLTPEPRELLRIDVPPNSEADTMGHYKIFRSLAMASLLDDIANLITVAITPALLLLGVMIQMRVLNNRLDRINDRSESLQERLSSGSGLRPALVHELSVLRRRENAIHRAFGLSTACMILICSVVVALFVDDSMHLKLDSLIAFAFVATMLLLVGSFSLLLHEIFIASHSLPATTLHRRQPEGQN